MDALTFSSGGNAYALFVAARELGIRLRTTDAAPTFPIPAEVAADAADWLFFTEESSLARALRGELKGRFLPDRFPARLLDDKWALTEWLAAAPGLTPGLRQWDLAERERAEFPCLVKARHSWRESVKLPRGWICRTREDVERALREIGARGFPPSAFFLQEWLGDRACRNLSVCGFHDHRDPGRNLVAVVERVAAHTAGLSCSAAVETVADAWDLRGRTAAVLDALEFTGPYELEFLVAGDRVAVLELNPRFWLQHAIFLARGNGLVKRYLGVETEADRRQRSVDGVVWIDGLHLVDSALRLRWGFVRLAVRRLRARKSEALIWPAPPTALYVLLRRFWNRRRGGFRKTGGKP